MNDYRKVLKNRKTLHRAYCGFKGGNDKFYSREAMAIYYTEKVILELYIER